MLQELYSRDFFCNTLLLNLELSQIHNPSGEGISDIQKKEIRTCLNPQITFGSDPKRLARAIYLAAKLGFQIEQNTKQFMVQNPNLLQQISPSYLAKKITKAFEYNPQVTTQLLTELNYWKYLSATPELIPYIQKNLV
jgi:poly(A) polymerase